MLRSSLIASAAVLLCTASSAQHSRVAGLQTANLKRGGVYDMHTGKFHAAGQGGLQAVQQNIYNNTCSSAAPGDGALPGAPALTESACAPLFAMWPTVA